MLMLKIGRFREKKDPDSRWVYVGWFVGPGAKDFGYNPGLDSDSVREGNFEGLNFDPKMHKAEVESRAIPAPRWLMKLVEGMNLIQEREGMHGVSDAGNAIQDDIKLMALRAYAKGKGDPDPLTVIWTSSGPRHLPLSEAPFDN